MRIMIVCVKYGQLLSVNTLDAWWRGRFEPPDGLAYQEKNALELLRLDIVKALETGKCNVPKHTIFARMTLGHYSHDKPLSVRLSRVGSCESKVARSL